MGFIDWLDSRDWTATGTMLTAAFTGFAAIWAVVSTRKKPRWVFSLADSATPASDGSGYIVDVFATNVGNASAINARLVSPLRDTLGRAESSLVPQEGVLRAPYLVRLPLAPTRDGYGDLVPVRVAPDDLQQIEGHIEWSQAPKISKRRVKQIRFR